MDVLPVLCLLLLGVCALTLAVDETVPLPEDLDGSGDDEDFSGSGSGSGGFFVDLESKDVTVFTSSVPTLVPTVEGSTAAQEPEIVDKEEDKPEHTTMSAETTKSPNDDVKEPIAVDTGDAEATTKEATTSPFQQEEIDAEKHHHHHHHHPHHHHTTTPSTTLPSESGGDDGTTVSPPAVDLPEQTTTRIPDTESGFHHVPQDLTTPVGDLAKHGVLHEETTSGATSTYVDNEEAAVDPLDNLPALVTTTVAEDSHTHEDHHHPPHHHHHHHHHHPHHSTTTPFGGLVVEEEVTTKPPVPVEPEGDVEEREKSTTVAEDVHPHHGHHHEITTTSTKPEEPYEVHTQNPKGRKVHVPDGRSTTAVPVISEDEHIPEDAENDELAGTTVQNNVSRSPFDENEETSDSKEEGPSGVADEELYFEKTNSILNEGRMNPSAEEGSSDSSHGIMERKELLAGIIAGGVAGLAFAAALVVFVLYRMKKKDEGSYSLEEPKQSNGGYQKPREQREFYA